MVVQQQQQQHDQQHNVHSYSAACDSWQQQQQQQRSSPFPSLSGTSYSGAPMMQQQQHSLRGVAAGAGVEGIPRELKAMAPLRRHQQYLGTT
jgi:hypothetical protein